MLPLMKPKARNSQLYDETSDFDCGIVHAQTLLSKSERLVVYNLRLKR